MSDSNAEMDLFLAALDLDSAARPEFLQNLNDRSLAERVARLLKAHDSMESGEPSILAPPGPVSKPPVESLVGQTIDGYRLTRVIGRGGMGVVFEAQQENPHRRVALKTLGFQAASDEEIRRFTREGRFLARLSHPGIAHVYGVGHSEALGGLPYIVLEFIDGRPVDEWVREQDVSLGERIRLLAEIGETVAHIHTRGVIHRDLKPDNIFIDTTGRSKILDFGIARLDRETDGASHNTRAGQILGTLPYMSPEQISGHADTLDGRTDVYALGVIAYEILSGHLPIEVNKVSMPSAIRQIIELEPPLLGTLGRGLGGDLQTVVMKALRKAADERYSSAAEFAADLRRILAEEPITARPHSRIYRLTKLVQRHRVATVLLILLVSSLATGLSWAILERNKAIHESKRAERAQKDSEEARHIAETAKAAALNSARLEKLRAASQSQLNNLLSGLIAATTPQQNSGNQPTVAEMVDQLAIDVDLTFANDPYVRAYTHLFLAEARIRSGRYSDGQMHLRKARDAFALSPLTDTSDRVRCLTAHDGPHLVEDEVQSLKRELQAIEPLLEEVDDDGRTERLLCGVLSKLLARQPATAPEAEVYARRAADSSARRFGEESLEHAIDLHQLGLVVAARDRVADAVALFEQVVTVRRALQPNSLALSTALMNLSRELKRLDQFARAEGAAAESLAIRRAIHRETPHIEVGFALDNLATIKRDTGQLPEALTLFEESERIFRLTVGDGAETTAVSLSEQALLHRFMGNKSRARDCVDEAIEIFRIRPGVPHTALPSALETLSFIQLEDNELEAGLKSAQEAVALRERLFGKEHVSVARALEVESTALLLHGRYDAALLSGRRLMNIREKAYGRDHWMTWADTSCIYVSLAQLGQLEEAVSLAEETWRRLVNTLAPQHAVLTVHRAGISGLYRRQGRLKEADEFEKTGRLADP